MWNLIFKKMTQIDLFTEEKQTTDIENNLMINK